MKGFQEYLEIRDQFETPFDDYLEGTRSEISQKKGAGSKSKKVDLTASEWAFL